MDVFNSLLIKHRRILFAVFPAFKQQINFPAELLLRLFCSFMRLWCLTYSLSTGSHGHPFFFLMLRLCNRQQGRVCLISAAPVFDIFPVVFWYNIKVEAAAVLKDWLWPKKKKGGVGCQFDSLLREPVRVEVSESHHSHQDTPLGTGLHWAALRCVSFQLECFKGKCLAKLSSKKKKKKRPNAVYISASELPVQWTHYFGLSYVKCFLECVSSQWTQENKCIELHWTWGVSHVVFWHSLVAAVLSLAQPDWRDFFI